MAGYGLDGDLFFGDEGEEVFGRFIHQLRREACQNLIVLVVSDQAGREGCPTLRWGVGRQNRLDFGVFGWFYRQAQVGDGEGIGALDSGDHQGGGGGVSGVDLSEGIRDGGAGGIENSSPRRGTRGNHGEDEEKGKEERDRLFQNRTPS